MKTSQLILNQDLLSGDALEVLELLGGKHLRIIQKDYPFKANRNKAIARLKKKGIKVHTLVELTGLKRASILRIVKGIKNGPPENSDALNRIARLLEELSKELSDIKTTLHIKERK